MADPSATSTVNEPAKPAGEVEVQDVKPNESVTTSSSSLAWLRAGLLLLMLLAGIAIAARPTYNWWHARQSQFYREACEEVAEAESWEHLQARATQWVEWDPNSSEGWVHLADALLKLSDLQGAVDALAHVDNSYPGVLDTLAVRGDILFSELNQPYEAVENWQRMLEINERADVARQRLIYFYAITMQRERMREEILRAMELKSEPPESYAYLLLAYEVTFSDGLRLTRKWLESYPDDETLQVAAAVYLAKFSADNTIRVLGTRSVGEGDHTLVNEMLETYPHNLEILAFHLEKAIFEGDEQRVVELLAKCPSSAELDCRFWRARGWLLSSNNRFEEAAQALERCVELNPFDWRGRLMFSGALRQLGRSEEAGLQSEIQLEGKRLHEVLFMLPNARSLDFELAERIYNYATQAGAAIVAESMERRIQPDNPGGFQL